MRSIDFSGCCGRSITANFERMRYDPKLAMWVSPCPFCGDVDCSVEQLIFPFFLEIYASWRRGLRRPLASRRRGRA